MKPLPITFQCGELKLEGLYFSLERQGPLPAVVVCHPHPLYGGSMHNNVTCAIADALVAVSMDALLFNFRGVGSSQGGYGGGVEEQKDIAAALEWLQGREGVDGGRLGLAGYSFGAGVALPVGCANERVKGIALISPYFENSPLDMLRGCRKPKLIMGGSNDDRVLPADVETYGEEAAEPKECEIIDGPDHFWGGYEGQMAESVAGFFKDIL